MVFEGLKIRNGLRLIKNKTLVYEMTKREIALRYKGSYLGLTWSFITPLLMLLVYMFVFGYVFKSRWGTLGTEGGKAQFALILFSGITAYNMFSEIITRAPGLILSNVNYVKKVVFPLVVLPIVITGSALFNAALAFFVLILVASIFGVLHWAIILLPLLIIPLVLFSLGLAWILAALGVFLRDLGQIVGIGVQALMFLTPIFYNIETVPPSFKRILLLNPLTNMISIIRNSIVWGQIPSVNQYLTCLLVSCLSMWIGYLLFRR